MALKPGTQLGPYAILEPIGAGGMGEVYKASDTRLNRTVAIKVLPAHFSDDPEMKQRFEREAQTIAGLNHPNVCTLYDVGVDGRVGYLVMEYLEGETLAERLQKGALPLEDALRIAIAIADALDKAHGRGVVHRDVKPSNIMLTAAGPKLLDFGLAKPQAEIAPSINVSSPGAILGTLQYMAPEQFEGKAADARSDIFAFGAVLYEMIAGRKAFEGKSRAILIATIATGEPEPLSKLQPKTPPALEHVVERCLAKDPEDRWQTAHALMIQLQWIAGGGSGIAAFSPVSTAMQKKERNIRIGIAAVALLIAVLAAPAVLYLRGPGEPDAFQFRVPVEGLSSSDIAFAPDGHAIALVSNSDAGPALYVRPTDSIEFKRLGGTEEAAQPFWSPDSRFIAFAARGRLWRIAAEGGPPKEIAEAQDFAGGAWSPAGDIVFGSSKGLFRVSVEGGKAAVLTTVDASQQETGHFWPNFLPDGKHVVYLAWSGQTSNRAVYMTDLDGKVKTRLLSEESNAAYAAPGYLVFHRGASLFAHPFDARNLKLTGEAIHLADEVAFSTGNGRGNFDVSQDGALLYFQGASAGALSGRGKTTTEALRWWSRSSQSDWAVEPRPYGDFNLSPDGSRIALTRQDPGAPGADVWTVEWQTGRWLKLTLDPSDDINPVWSPPKGDRIAFTTYRKGNADIYIVNSNGVGPETPVLDSAANESVKDWSKDGRYLLYMTGQDQFEDIYAVALTPDGKVDGKPISVVEGKFEKGDPQFSYDGKWVAYVSKESGTYQVYVKSFPGGEQRATISTEGGGQPRWRKDGKEMYYRDTSPNGGAAVMAVTIKPGPKFEAEVPQVLFRLPGAAPRDPNRHYWAVDPTGQRFLMLGNPNNYSSARGTPGAPAAVTVAPPVFTPGPTPNSRGSFGGRGGRGGRGGGGDAAANGLTVIRHRMALVRKEAK